MSFDCRTNVGMVLVGMIDGGTKHPRHVGPS